MYFRRNSVVDERMVPGLFVIFLILVSLTDVTGQTIVLEPFNKSLTTSACEHSRRVIEGERIVLTAVLNASQTKLSDWPLNKILLISEKDLGSTVLLTIRCQVDIERDQCRGLRPDLCGYCDYNHGSEYHLIFNITANSSEPDFHCNWVGSSNSTNSSSINIDILGPPKVQITTEKRIGYTMQNITSSEFILIPEVSDVEINVNPYFMATCAIRFGTDSMDQKENIRRRMGQKENIRRRMDQNITAWDEHIGDTIKLKCREWDCGTNFTYTAPVIERPTVVCDYPTLTRSNVLGTQLSFSCTINSFWKSLRLYCSIRWPYYIVIEATVLGDRWTCLFPNVSADIATSPHAINIGTTVYQVLDGPGSVPLVHIFKVNSLSSITVDIGTDLNFECKVYGDRMTTAVLIGPGRRGRVQESRSQTDLLKYTLTGAQCQDSGRYTCKGVNSVGTTPRDTQGYVDVIVNCPTTIIDQESREKNNRVTFDPNSAVIITLEVIGYPAPNQFSVRGHNGSTFTEVSQDEYSIKYVELRPTRGLITLWMSGDGGQRSGLYVLTFSNGYNTSTDIRFDFEIGQFFESGLSETESSTSHWLYAFIAVICVLGVIIIVIIIVYFVKKHPRKKRGERDYDDVKFEQTTVGNPHQQQTQQPKVPNSGPPTIHSVQSDNQQYESMSSSRSTGNNNQQPKSTPSTQQVKVTKPDPSAHQPTTTNNPPYANTDSTEDESIYENPDFESVDNPEVLYELAG